MALKFLGQLYSLDTLDTRFVIPATSPPIEILEDPARSPPDDYAKNKSRSGDILAQPPLWRTPEFFFYYLIILTCVPLMFKAVLDVSKESHPNYSKFSHLLSNGWIPGRRVDNSDAQYSGFRQNIPYLVLVVLLHRLSRKAYDGFWRADADTNVRPLGLNSDLTMGLTPAARANARLEQRISFDALFAVAFLVILHGLSAFKILVILYANFCIGTKLPRAYVPAATWSFNIAVLFTNEFSKGYSYGSMIGLLLPSPKSENGDAPVNFGHMLDKYGGLIPRWEVLFNFTILRLISFNLDYYWSTASNINNFLEKKQLDPSNLSERDRVSIPAQHSDFIFRNYFAYTMYSPLYLAGPILTFNDYISQQRYRSHSNTGKRKGLYAIRFIIVLLTMEIMIHYMYMVAIFHAQPTWSAYTPAQLSMLGFFNLKHIWLKLLIPWRFFRLWALLDSIDPPENMVRCMSDNYSVMHFWRGWHRSFNKWSLRYLYIPLGGSGGTGLRGKVKAVSNYLVVFTFIAIWHDIQLRLLMWGWLVTLFVLPEIIASYLFPARKWKEKPGAYRVLCGIGAVGEILLLMTANLVGFALGLDGLKDLWSGIVGTWSGQLFFWFACAALFVGVQVMFEWRENEKRKGIRMKC